MNDKMVILWNAAKLTGTRTSEDSRVHGLRNHAVARLEMLGYTVTATSDVEIAKVELADAEIYMAR